MTRKFQLFCALVAMSLLGAPAQAGDHEFVGAAKCKTCHAKEDIGDQYNKWLSSKHAKAMDSLSTEQAKKWATEAGVADPTTDEACVKCHTTAYGVSDDLKGSKFTHTEGVSCEACHGPGSDYRKKKVMVDPDESREKGLIDPTEKVCTTCHNPDSPAYEGFDYKSAVKKLAHSVPEGYDPFADDEDEE